MCIRCVSLVSPGLSLGIVGLNRFVFGRVLWANVPERMVVRPGGFETPFHAVGRVPDTLGAQDLLPSFHGTLHKIVGSVRRGKQLVCGRELI